VVGAEGRHWGRDTGREVAVDVAAVDTVLPSQAQVAVGGIRANGRQCTVLERRGERMHLVSMGNAANATIVADVVKAAAVVTVAAVATMVNVTARRCTGSVDAAKRGCSMRPPQGRNQPPEGRGIPCARARCGR
jgi:hypothetical protein